MNKKTQAKPKSQEINGVTFYCEACNSIGKVYVEYWTNQSDGPYKIDLIQHDDFIAIAVDEIKIIRKPKGEILQFPFCGHCGQLLDKPMDSDYIKAIGNFNPKFSNN